MPESLRENQHPVNQAAKQWLLRLQEQSPRREPLLAMDQQYSLQLMQWALEQPKNPFYQHLIPALEQEVLSLLSRKNQAGVLQFLLRPLEPSDNQGDPLQDADPEAADAVNQAQLQQAKDPLEAGLLLLNQLHDQMMLHLPAYPPPAPRGQR